ncbi:OmpA family protein [Muricauda sp. SCSIO 64092]|uniref:OmpA family protein n=1 Tax=Allomuricauda sp. SCSIO 64092 TaxID=2908842 RepID=UPI001FF59F14|nr:OmpA family protein [Muricauda sp. SCSIO 64092]UOY06080.1 OmpA family protein [Muricauda sp. SCSIO 64092]
MRIPKSIVCFAFLLSFQLGFTQDLALTKKDSIVQSAWILGIGFNVVDDSGDEFGEIFDISDSWNAVPFPSRLSIGRYFKNGLGLEAIGSYNRYNEGKIIDGVLNTEDIDYYAIDFRVSYDLNQILGETGWFDPYVGIGAGYTDANNQGRGTYNASVGFRTWFSDRFGLDFNSTGKWAMSTENATNHIQHAAGAVYRFGIEKGLSKKGEEKLARMQEMEKEQQRIQDSIAAAQRAEQEARLLAERLEREEESRLAEKEKALLDAEKNAKRKRLEEMITALGYVYFDLNSSYLNKKDKELLDELIIILEENPTLVLEVSSHTDARGTDEYNLWLSKRRVKRTVDYFSSNGIGSERIVSKALGEEKLTNECDDRVYCTEEKHGKNRRSEFKILEF